MATLEQLKLVIEIVVSCVSIIGIIGAWIIALQTRRVKQLESRFIKQDEKFLQALKAQEQSFQSIVAILEATLVTAKQCEEHRNQIQDEIEKLHSDLSSLIGAHQLQMQHLHGPCSSCNK